MRRIGTTGVCLAALFAITAVAASSASAAPEFFECHKGAKGSGEYSDKKCSVNVGAGEGIYTLQPGIGKGKVFHGSGGALTYHTPALGMEIACKSVKEEGTITSPTEESEVSLIITGCVTLGKPCQSVGALKGEIVTNLLKGTFGYIRSSPLDVGVVLAPETGTDWADFSCENLEIVDTGSIIGEMTGGVNEFNKTRSITYGVTAKPAYVQIPTKFEGGPTEELLATVNGSGPFSTSFEAKIPTKGEELNLKA